MSNVPVHRTDVVQPAIDILDSLYETFSAETPIKVDCTKFDLSKYSAIRISGFVRMAILTNVGLTIVAGNNNTLLTGWKIKDGTMSTVRTSDKISLATENNWSAGASIDLFISSNYAGTDGYPMLVKFLAATYSGNYRSLYEFTLYHDAPFETLKEINFGNLGRGEDITVYGYRK